MIEYLLTSMIVILLPGTGVIYTIAIGLGRGLLPSIAAAFGCTLGILPAAIASIVGLATIFHTSALAFQIIKYIGVAYLFYMAWSILRDGGGMVVEKDSKPRGLMRIALDGMLLNIFNPKLSLFFLAFLPQFVPEGATNTTFVLSYLALIFMALTFIVFIGYGAFAAAARDKILQRPRIMKSLKAVFASAFGLLGLRLALEQR